MSTLGKGKLQVIFFGKREIIYDIFRNYVNCHTLSFEGYSDWNLDGVKIPQSPSTYSAIRLYPEVLTFFQKCTPIFSRHYKELFFLDLELRTIALQTLAIFENISKFGSSIAYMGTSGSHHIPSMMFEMACRLLGVPQVFEVQIYEGLALPMIQKNSVEDRLPISSRPFEKFQISSLVHPLDKKFKATVSWVNFHSSYSKAFVVITKSAIRKLLRPRNLWKRHRHFSKLGFHGTVTDIKIWFSHLRAISYYRNLQKAHSSSINNILESNSRGKLIPLIVAHFQPESTTFPEGGRLHNHLDIVVELRAKGVIGPIFYKEHPIIFASILGDQLSKSGVSRSKQYYDSLIALGCFFVSDDYNLLNFDTALPITITGSIAIERGVRGLPTVVVGPAWYRGLPGTLTLDQFIDKILTGGNLCSHDQEDSIKFLQQLVNGRLFSLKPLLWAYRKEIKDMEMQEWRFQFHKFICELIDDPPVQIDKPNDSLL